jgi:hypothetical protein
MMFLSPERFDGFRIAKDTTDIGDRERVNRMQKRSLLNLFAP